MKQSKKRVIVITGSIGTGKSTAVSIIRKMGFQVLDSDKIVHEGYNIGSELYQEVVACYGKKILNDEGSINRQKLGKLVFNNEDKLKCLNDIVHVYVINELMNGVNNSKDEVVFLDIPLVLEEKDKEISYGLKYDEVWLIYVSKKTQIERLIKRAENENKKPEDVLKIIEKQLPIEKKKSMVDDIINNEGTVEDLEKNIKELFKLKNIRW